MKKFTGVCLITKNIEGLSAFYGQILQAEFERQADFAAISTRGAGLTLFSQAGMQQMAPGSLAGAGCGGSVLEFEVEDVDQECERLARMEIPIVKPPQTHPWGRRSFWFRDPDGNLVNFYADLAGSGPEAAEAVVRAYFRRALNERDGSVFAELLASDYIDHDAPEGTIPGPEEPREFVARFLDQVPDLRVEIKNLLASGDQVAAQLIWRGHHKDSGDEFYQMGIVILRVNQNGQISERWSAYKSSG